MGDRNTYTLSIFIPDSKSDNYDIYKEIDGIRDTRKPLIETNLRLHKSVLFCYRLDYVEVHTTPALKVQSHRNNAI